MKGKITLMEETLVNQTVVSCFFEHPTVFRTTNPVFFGENKRLRLSCLEDADLYLSSISIAT